MNMDKNDGWKTLDSGLIVPEGVDKKRTVEAPIEKVESFAEARVTEITKEAKVVTPEDPDKKAAETAKQRARIMVWATPEVGVLLEQRKENQRRRITGEISGVERDRLDKEIDSAIESMEEAAVAQVAVEKTQKQEFIKDPALFDLYRYADDASRSQRSLEDIKNAAGEISAKLYNLGALKFPSETKLSEAYVIASKVKESYQDVEQSQSAMKRIASLIFESDGFKDASLGLDKTKEEPLSSSKKRMDEIKQFEQANGVTQDILAQSYLAHVDIYNQLNEKSTAAMNRYFRLEEMLERDSPLIDDVHDDPSVIEARKEWKDADAEKERVYSIMSPMVEHLTQETLKKYRKDFERHGAVNTVDFPEKQEEKTSAVEDNAEEVQNQEAKKSEPYSPSFENTDNLTEELKNERTIRNVHDFNSLMKAIDMVGDITGSDGYVYKPDYLKDVIGEVFIGRKQLNYVTRTFGLRDKVESLLSARQLEMDRRAVEQAKSPEEKVKDKIFETEDLDRLREYREKAGKVETHEEKKPRSLFR